VPPDSSLNWRYSINSLTHPQSRCLTLSHDLVLLTHNNSSFNPCRTHTTSTISASRSTSKTTPFSNGASISNTSPNPNTSPISRMWLIVLSLWESLFVHRESNRLSRYPGPTLKALDLVQQERFRRDILRPDVVETLTNTWMGAFMPPKE
jgi:hypothetical protein